MPQSLLLRLPAPGQEETEWLALDETGAPAPTRQRGSLSLAAAVARTARLVVLAPTTQILLAEPELPPGSGSKLARAVPFALEEHLTEDVDQLSFAVGRRRERGTPVAVVSRCAAQVMGIRVGSGRTAAAGHLRGHFVDAGKSGTNGAVAGRFQARGAPARCAFHSPWNSRRSRKRWWWPA